MSDPQPKSDGAGAPPVAPAVDPAGAVADSTGAAPPVHPQKPITLALAALGIVFGDIGTSPLYALKECFHGAHAVVGGPTHDNVLGVLSLVFWSLTVVVTIKYLAFIMRADNKGEGGIFALLALVPANAAARSPRMKAAVVLLALFGASLLYGDGIITPAISVLSAVEGLEVATSAAKGLVVPITCAVLVGLFLLQKRGTQGIGRVFGPIMALWFVTIAVLGVVYIWRNPSVLAALNPYWAVAFFQQHHLHGLIVLGSVVLCITGGEALYADMGHMGASPIRRAWFAMVFPALLLNYFGQGAMLLENAAGASNPFYKLVPQVLLYPMVALATVATVIASQALISGAFSLTRQAVQLGYFPRVTIVHTSRMTEGQIYIPEVNTALMLSCLALVLAFGDSSRLAAAYGIAVTGTMAITSLVYYFVITRNWHWPLYKALPLVLAFLFFDLGYFSANLLKFFEGGWLPIVVAAGIFVLMTTWKTGRAELAARFAQNSMPLATLLDDVGQTRPHRVRGTAVFMSSASDGTPPVLLHHLKHNQVLHQQVVLLSIVSVGVPTVPRAEQLEVEDRGNGFFRVSARYGFMETPNVPEILHRCRKKGLKTEPNSTSYYLGRETLLTSGSSKMMRWRKVLFAFVSRNARSATAYFGIPPGRVVELGMQVDL
ncbi:MAG: potassium transporter Kup [Myxococcaceae bacterium]